MTVPKILLVGRLRSGKSSVADYLRYTHDWTEISFGGMLKYYANLVFTHSAITEGDGKPRELFQKFGQACRSIDENVWLQHADFAYQMALDRRATKGIVCSDGRQPNEIVWAKANGFKVIRVTAPEAVRLERARKAGDAFELANLAHETEQHSDKFSVDYEIINDGTLDELRAKVDAVMTEIKEAE